MTDSSSGQPRLDQKEIADAIGRHMDAVAAILGGSLVLALLLFWSGFSGQRSVQSLGIEMSPPQAMVVAFAVYSFTTFAMAVHFLRIGDLLKSLDGDGLVPALTRLGVHQWVFNPFAYFGSSRASRLSSCYGECLLTVAWATCVSSLMAVVKTFPASAADILLLAFGWLLLLGMATSLAIMRVQWIVLRLTREHVPDLYQSIWATRWQRSAAQAVGYALSFATLVLVAALKFKTLPATGGA